MLKNLNLTRGLIFSQAVLLKLTEKGMSREDAYAIVQTLSMKVWENSSKSLKDELLNSSLVKKFLSQKDIEELFDPNKLLKNVDYIFSRSIEMK